MASTRKSRITAGVLAILLGGIGIHHFYMGKVGLGVLCIVFCGCGIPWVCGVIQGIVILCETDAQFARRCK